MGENLWRRATGRGLGAGDNQRILGTEDCADLWLCLDLVMYIRYLTYLRYIGKLRSGKWVDARKDVNIA